MHKKQIKQLIEENIPEDGIIETGVDGVSLFRVSKPVHCVPAVYEPTVVAIVNGAKEAILDGKRHIYGSNNYMCCTMSMPVEAGTPTASPEDPLLGVMISLDSKVLTELTIEMESAKGAIRQPKGGPLPQGIILARWDTEFSEALYRLLKLGDSQVDRILLGKGRLRELYYAVLNGDAGDSVRRAFGVGNEIAATIEYLSTHLKEPVTIEEMAERVNMSRAVFHRKFKQATTMSPIQFIKSLRLNKAATKIAEGMTVNLAALEVGYVSSSQLSREFKRMFGQSPKKWRASYKKRVGIA